MRIHKITRRNFMKVAGVSALAMGLQPAAAAPPALLLPPPPLHLLPLLQAARSPVIRS